MTKIIFQFPTFPIWKLEKFPVVKRFQFQPFQKKQLETYKPLILHELDHFPTFHPYRGSGFLESTPVKLGVRN